MRPRTPAARPTCKGGHKLRKLWLNLHLNLALAVGFLFVVMGLTGSCNVFMDEIDEVFNPDLVIQTAGRGPLPLDEGLDTLRRRLIQRAGRLIRPQGQLTLSMSGNADVRDELLHYLEV